LDFGGHAHLLATPGPEELIGVAVLGDEHVGDQTGEPPQQSSVIVVDGVEGERQDPELDRPSRFTENSSSRPSRARTGTTSARCSSSGRPVTTVISSAPRPSGSE
jgi:hypothetical protein